MKYLVKQQTGIITSETGIITSETGITPSLANFIDHHGGIVRSTPTFGQNQRSSRRNCPKYIHLRTKSTIITVDLSEVHPPSDKIIDHHGGIVRSTSTFGQNQQSSRRNCPKYTHLLTKSTIITLDLSEVHPLSDKIIDHHGGIVRSIPTFRQNPATDASYQLQCPGVSGTKARGH
jgi:hypothetical protein